MKTIREIIKGDTHSFLLIDENGKETPIDFRIEDVTYKDGSHALRMFDMDDNPQPFGNRMFRCLSGSRIKKEDFICFGNAMKDFYAFAIAYDKHALDFDNETCMEFLSFLRGDSSPDIKVEMRPRGISTIAAFRKMFDGYDFPPPGSKYSWREEKDLFLDFEMRYADPSDPHAVERLAWCRSFKDTPDHLGMIKMGITVATNKNYSAGARCTHSPIVKFWKRNPFFKNHFPYPEKLHPNQDLEPYEVYPYISDVEYGLLMKAAEDEGDGVARYMMYLLFKYGVSLSCIAGLTYEDLVMKNKETGKRVLTFCNRETDKGFQKKKKSELTRGYYNSDYFKTVDVSDMFLQLEMDDEDIRMTNEFLESVRASSVKHVPAEARYGGENFYLFADAKGKMYSASTWNKKLLGYFAMVGIPEMPTFPGYPATDMFRNGYVMKVLYFSDEYLDDQAHYGFDPREVEAHMTPLLDITGTEDGDSRFISRLQYESFPQYWLTPVYYERRRNLVRIDV